MIIYAHGRDGTPWGAKVTALRSAGFDVLAPDLRGLDLAARVQRLDELTRKNRGLLVGSSYGGLAAVLLAARAPERVDALVLLAPALQLYEPPVVDPNRLFLPRTVRATIVHGARDETVPIDCSRRFAARSGAAVRLIEVDDDHRLAASLPVVIQAVRALLVER